MPVDLFGVAHRLKKKRDESPKGYARRPGSGPAGETCGTCASRVRLRQGGKTFSKCGKARGIWTHSRRTDILQASPACAAFEKRAAAPVQQEEGDSR